MPGGQAGEKVTVVADNDQRPLIAEQRLLQRLLRRDIQMVGRLVHHQHIRMLHHQKGKLDPGALSARENPDLFEGLLSDELKPAEQGAQLVLGRGREPVPKLHQRRLIGVQIGGILLKDRKAHVAAPFHRAAPVGQAAGQRFQQG